MLMSPEIQPRITMKANVKYLDIAKVIQACPHALAPFSNYMGDPFLCTNSLQEWNLEHARSVMGVQAWSEKIALKVGNGVSHGNSHEEAPSAVLG